ncbi:Cytokinesis protein sepH [Neolecta irregularis DAH-3]|uniref:non-specific serine/threonine protein kinase n=1 Tax=Neolecta irregularis (strain DAH-3) TaxID=1198029 RepID=A0A1U7LIU4_NEOID|nr:Cytokinesis protein sepH [Neolecta irregularis DAH-3]|eukprot:OLL22575.1 Cytokinesis protein sepH [Neolecta irregularis DAH-3]
MKIPTSHAPLHNFTLGDCLGKGAFASVYRALNFSTGEVVAIKQIKLASIPKSELKVIMMEIDLLKNLNHQNIVKYLGFVKDPNYLNIILEFCENGSLYSICKNFGKFPENLVALYINQVLQGLVYLHEQGVIHRDIKGANILTTKDGAVKLADFGVATRATGLNDFSVVGSPYWMAPEVIELSGATAASDIWSLGCTVIELLEGQPPYHEYDPMPALFHIVNDDHPPIPESASPAVRDFLMQCFQKDPNFRVSARKLLKHSWIQAFQSSGNRDKLFSKTTTKYDDAVKSVQQWNEALKGPPEAEALYIPRRALEQRNVLLDGRRPSLARPGVTDVTRGFRSPDMSAVGNVWDDDFEVDASLDLKNFNSRISPQRNKIMKKMALGLKNPRLTQIAHAEDGGTNWDDDFEGGLTFQTISGSKTIDNSLDERLRTIKLSSSNDSRNSTSGFGSGESTVKASKLSYPMRSSSKRGSDDYSDLIDEEDASFTEKIQTFKQKGASSGKLFHPSDLRNISRRSSPAPSKSYGNLRRYHSTKSDASNIELKRSRSWLEIQRYAEIEGEEDYSDVFGKDDGNGSNGTGDQSSEVSSLMLNTKLSSNSWLGAEGSDEEDPFADIDEGFDEMDLDANIARDKHARVLAQINQIVSKLQSRKNELGLLDSSNELLELLIENRHMKDHFRKAMLPIIEILEVCLKRDVQLVLLKIVNLIIADDIETLENLCSTGVIPTIICLATKKSAVEVRREAAVFVRELCQTSLLALQMFMCCAGLDILVEFVGEDYEQQTDLVQIGINGISSVLDPQTPLRYDFCRVLVKKGVLDPLTMTLEQLINNPNEINSMYTTKIVDIIYLFSQADEYVKSLVASRSVTRRLLKDITRLEPPLQIILLKFIKNLSMVPTTLDNLQNANVIDILVQILAFAKPGPYHVEMSNHILATMFNLCRLDLGRQEEAALAGVIPVLQRIVRTDRPLKEFALPILCDFAHAGKTCRKILWQNNGLEFYIVLLADPYWQVNALDAVLAWYQEETARVEDHLVRPASTAAISKAFATSKNISFEGLLDPLHKLLRLSAPLARSFARSEVFQRISERLGHPKAVIRLNLLRILCSICDSHPSGYALLQEYNLSELIHRLNENESTILVRGLSQKILAEITGSGSVNGSTIFVNASDFGPPRQPNFSRRTSKSSRSIGDNQITVVRRRPVNGKR